MLIIQERYLYYRTIRHVFKAEMYKVLIRCSLSLILPWFQRSFNRTRGRRMLQMRFLSWCRYTFKCHQSWFLLQDYSGLVASQIRFSTRKQRILEILIQQVQKGSVQKESKRQADLKESTKRNNLHIFLISFDVTLVRALLYHRFHLKFKSSLLLLI